MVSFAFLFAWRTHQFFAPGRNIRYRSAAEFAPHALWLWEVANTRDPPPICKCLYCSDGGGVAGGKKNLPQEPRVRSKPVTPVTPRTTFNARPTKTISGIAHPGSSKVTGNVPPNHEQRPSIITHNHSILAHVRVSTPIVASNPYVGVCSTGGWPLPHELVWCELRRPIIWTGVLIDLWPGIVKEHNDGSTQYLVTLIGIARDERVSLDAMVPYRAHQTGDALVRVIRQSCQGQSRLRLLDLDRYLGPELDDDGRGVVSSAFLFALEFSGRLTTVWSWTSELGTPGHSSVRSSRYALRSRRSKTQYDALWWGPECIKRWRLVQLKMSKDVIAMGEDASNGLPPAKNHSVALDTLTFLQIHSISYLPRSQRGRGSLCGPVVAGMIFGLTDGDQRGEQFISSENSLHIRLTQETDQNQSHDLPLPPLGKVFRPLLKEGREIVLPVTALSGRYYGEIHS